MLGSVMINWTHHQPFVIYIEDIPLPKDTFWSNGRNTNKADT